MKFGDTKYIFIQDIEPTRMVSPNLILLPGLILDSYYVWHLHAEPLLNFLWHFYSKTIKFSCFLGEFHLQIAINSLKIAFI